MTLAADPTADPTADPAVVRASTAGGRRPSGFALLIALLALVAAAKAVQSDTMDPDAFWHLRVADQLRADGIGPLVDRLSFASDKSPWTPYSWLAELAMRAVWAAGGFRAATLVTAACSAAIVALTAVAARARTRTANDAGVALLVAVAAFFTLPFVSFRPVTFALVLIALIVVLFVKDRHGPTPWVWVSVPLTVVLTNVHLYAVVVVVLAWLTVAGAWLDERPRFGRRVRLAAAVSLAACATPMLGGAVLTAVRYNAIDPMVASNFITEMRPFYSGATGNVSLALFAGLMSVCVYRRKALGVTDALWLALGAVLLFRLGRFSPVFALLATPAFARACPPLAGRTLQKPLVRGVLAVVLVAGAANLLPSLREHDFGRWLNRNAPAYPVAAAEFVATGVTPTCHKLVNEFNWGGYLAWRLGDDYRVLMDGRTQLYAPSFWKRTHLGDAASRLAFLKTIDADAAVLPAKDSCFAASLRTLGWREAFRDDLAVVLVPPRP